VLILDEPTAVLTPQESRDLFATLRQLVTEGLSIIFISHKLDEVLAVSDRICRAAQTAVSLPFARRARRHQGRARRIDGRPRGSSCRRGRARREPGVPVLDMRDVRARDASGGVLLRCAWTSPSGPARSSPLQVSRAMANIRSRSSCRDCGHRSEGR
jgi:simple sugar transport system ATP-binding protein